MRFKLDFMLEKLSLMKWVIGKFLFLNYVFRNLHICYYNIGLKICALKALRHAICLTFFLHRNSFSNFPINQIASRFNTYVFLLYCQIFIFSAALCVIYYEAQTHTHQIRHGHGDIDTNYNMRKGYNSI
jgi:hypothetical protein